jgi:hypothetical protein
MGISVFPIPAAGGIKSVQRGLAGASGNVTITSVDINKSFVNITIKKVKVLLFYDFNNLIITIDDSFTSTKFN